MAFPLLAAENPSKRKGFSRKRGMWAVLISSVACSLLLSLASAYWWLKKKEKKKKTICKRQTHLHILYSSSYQYSHLGIKSPY